MPIPLYVTMMVPCMKVWILQWYRNVPSLLKVKENFWPWLSWPLMNMAPVENNGVASLMMVCGAESWFVQVTVVPVGTVTDAGTKAKFWIPTSTVDGNGVVGAAVVVMAGTVVDGGVVATGVVGTDVTGVVAAGVAGGVVTAGVAWVVAGAGP